MARTLAASVLPRVYAHRLRTHVLPVIGAVELTKLRPAHVEQVMADMSARGLSTSTIRDARMILGNALRQAVAWGLITGNPVQAIRPPKVEAPQLHIPNPEQVAALIEVARGTVWDVPLFLAAVTGARRGEVLAVAWSEVDLESGRLRIVRSLQESPGDPRFLPPKTKQGRRGIVLTPFAVERLRQHRAEQLERRLAWGRRGTTSISCASVVTVRQFDHTLSAKRSNDWRPRRACKQTLACTTSGTPWPQLARSGTVHPKIASSWLGHASVAFTLDTYTEDWSEGALQAADAIAGVFGTTR